jgi:CTP synthase (UTP-ammonia lyase)
LKPLDASWKAELMTQARIAVIGDYQPGNPTHEAIASAVQHSAAAREWDTGLEWIPTEEAEHLTDLRLEGDAGFWITPGSPYRSMEPPASPARRIPS